MEAAPNLLGAGEFFMGRDDIRMVNSNGLVKPELYTYNGHLKILEYIAGNYSAELRGAIEFGYLHLVCSFRRVPDSVEYIRKALIEDPTADVNRLDQHGFTPTDCLLAVPGKHVYLSVEYMIARGSKPVKCLQFLREQQTFLRECTDTGELIQLIDKDKLATLKVLISNGFYSEQDLIEHNVTKEILSMYRARVNCKKILVAMIGIRKKRVTPMNNWDKFLVKHLCFEIWSTRSDLGWACPSPEPTP